MIGFAARYLKALLAVSAAMGVYVITVARWIEPQNAAADRPPLFSRKLPDNYWWQAFFPPDSWQTQNPKIINTHQGILLSKSWESIDEKTWRLAPLTMIMPASSDEHRSPAEAAGEPLEMWVISAEQGATIHFEEPPDITGSSVPTIVRGDLSGAIDVTRQVSGQNEGQPWRLQTSDLVINRTQVSTRQKVRIDWNDSVIEGRELRILLRGDLLGNQNAVTSDWGPLDELELYHVDTIDLALPPGGIWADLDPRQLNPNSPAPEQLRAMPARLKATCGGRFTFDFNRSTATLQNGVRVVHSLGNLPSDEFLCERITFNLDPPNKNTRSNTNQDSQSQVGFAGIQFNRIEAVGADSVQDFVGEKWVDLKLPMIDLSARAKRLYLDLSKQRVEFNGQLNHQDATRSTVLLRQRGNEFRSPHIEYQLPPQTETEEGNSRQLGWLFAEGPGELKTSQSDVASTSALGSRQATASVQQGAESQEIRVRWQKSLRMKPVADLGPNMHWIELLGNTLIESEHEGFLTSERLEIWLAPQESPGLVSAAPLPGESQTGSYRPQRIYSSTPTTLATSTMRASVAGLDAILEYRSQPPPPDDSQSAMEDQELRLSGSAGGDTGDRQAYLSQPSSKAPPQDLVSVSGRTGGPSAAPVVIQGDQLRAVIAQAGENVWIDKLQIGGPVRVSQPPQPGSTNTPWHVEGDMLLLATEKDGKADLQVEGAPAKMVFADGFLAGKSIRLNQKHNLVVMDHPGEFTLPNSLLARGDSESASPESAGIGRGSSPPPNGLESLQAIQWFQAPRCKWSGRMIFNGSVVRIEGDIEFDAGMRTAPDQFWWVVGTSQLMEIFLAEPISLQDTETRSASLDRIELSQQVRIRGSQLDQAGDKKSREEIQVPSLTFHVEQGQMIGRGPGWIQSRFLSETSLGQMASHSPGNAASSLRGAFLAFRDSMVASMNNKEVTFEGKVELLAGPLRNWDDSIRPDEMERLKPEQILLNSDQLKVYDTQQLSTHAASGGTLVGGRDNETWEFKATGNVAFNGLSDSGDFLGNGYQLTYVRAKNQMRLKGDGRIPAYLQRVPREAGDSLFKAYVNSVAIDPETLEIFDLRLAAGGIEVQPGGAQDPSAAWTNPQGGLPSQPPASNIPDPRQNFFDRDARKR